MAKSSDKRIYKPLSNDAKDRVLDELSYMVGSGAMRYVSEQPNDGSTGSPPLLQQSSEGTL